MTGAILVVSGPTVVGPLLTFVRPSDRLQRILSWEGSLIDPVGGILGAVVFHAVLASTHGGIGHPLGQFVLSVAIGAAGAAVGVAVLWLCLCKLHLDDVLSTSAQLAAVVGVAAACDIVRGRRRAHRRDPDGTGGREPPRLRHPGPEAVLRDPGAADHRGPVRVHLGDRHPRLAA
jgi:hypothetical protein